MQFHGAAQRDRPSIMRVRSRHRDAGIAALDLPAAELYDRVRFEIAQSNTKDQRQVLSAGSRSGPRLKASGIP